MSAQSVELPGTAKSLTLKLDPAEWRQTARDFLRYYNISAATACSIDKLGEVLQAFIAIPYENLSKIIKFNQKHQDADLLRLPDEVWQDFRRHRLGGTCFSLTFFLDAVLHELGFTTYPVMARMNTGPNRHCALIILHEGHRKTKPSMSGPSTAKTAPGAMPSAMCRFPARHFCNTGWILLPGMV